MLICVGMPGVLVGAVVCGAFGGCGGPLAVGAAVGGAFGGCGGNVYPVLSCCVCVVVGLGCVYGSVLYVLDIVLLAVYCWCGL